MLTYGDKKKVQNLARSRSVESLRSRLGRNNLAWALDSVSDASITGHLVFVLTPDGFQTLGAVPRGLYEFANFLAIIFGSNIFQRDFEMS